MKRLITLALLVLFVQQTDVLAQNKHYNSMTLGMGGGGVAVIDGYHANFLNPANLMLNDGRVPSTQVGLLGGLGVHAGGSLLNINVYNEYLTKGLTIEGQTREDMLDAWFGSNSSNTRDISFTNDIVPFGFSKRTKKAAFALATRVRTMQDITLNKGAAEVYFYGLDSDKFSNPVPFNLNSKTLSYAEVSVGYAMALPIPLEGLIESLPFINELDLYAGVAPKFLFGLQSFELDFQSTLEVNSPLATGNTIIHDFDYTIYTYGDIATQLNNFVQDKESNPDAVVGDYLDYSGSDIGTLGSGFGLDLGITIDMDVSLPVLNALDDKQELRLSVAVSDVGSISYDNNPHQFTGSSIFTFDADAGGQEVGDFYDNLSDSLSNDVYGDFNSSASGAKTYDLPGTFSFGAALLVGKLTTSLDVSFGFNELGNNSKSSIMTLGAEYRFLDFIPIRLGTRLGGGTSTAFSFGTGVDIKNLEFSVSAMTVTDSSVGGAAATMAVSGLVLRF